MYEDVGKIVEECYRFAPMTYKHVDDSVKYYTVLKHQLGREKSSILGSTSLLPYNDSVENMA